MTGSHVASMWGASLPVTVTEVLTLSGAGAEVTVRLGRHGWAWLVSGRRLVVWRYTTGGGRAQCRELSLPPSDLAHRADLCLVGQGEGGQTPFCLAVSPEGVVRYWPSIAQEGTSSEISAELVGQECFRVTDIHPVGSLLATTTATLVLIHHTQHGLECRRLAAPSGLLGGLGRRMSSLLWGSLPAGGGEGRMVSVAARATDQDREEVSLYVLTSTGLQKWQLGLDSADKFFYECDVTSLAREAVWSVWPGPRPDTEGASALLRVWLVDLAVSPDTGHSEVLVACVSQHDTSNTVHYALVQFRTLTNASPISHSAVHLLPPLSCCLGAASEPRQYRVMRAEDWAYLHHQDGVVMVQLGGADTSSLSTRVLGTGATQDHTPLYFSSQHGVISLALNKTASDADTGASPAVLDTTKSKLCDSLNVSVSAAGLENLTMSENLTDQLKAAFLLHCKRSNNQAEAIVEELFPAADSAEVLDSNLDRLVVGLSKDLIDDFPASDPRWVESLAQAGSAGVGASSSLLVLHQLEDKLACHQFYLGFLKSVGLWARLSGVTDRGQAVSTAVKLAEHAEKTVAAVNLRTIHLDHQTVIDQAIKTCLHERDVTVSGNLTDQDHFYREISKVDDILPALVGVIRFSIRSDCPRDVLATIRSVNTVTLTVIRECLAARNKRMAEFQYSGNYEFVPWTSNKRVEMKEMFKLTLEHGVSVAEDLSQRQSLHQQLVQLADIVLDSYSGQLASVKTSQDKAADVEKCLARDRAALIGQLVDKKIYEEAAGLAEKYQDWDSLVRICEESGNREKLEQYMERLASTDFSAHVYAWYVKQGKQNKLLSLSKSRHGPDLTNFLTHHNDISWLHDIQTQNYGQAAATLAAIAQQEGAVLARKKTQLSLAKLSALAGPAGGERDERVQELEQEMCLVAAQEQLPTSVLSQFGFDRENMRVLTPREMIELYVGDENVEADHIDFKKALDLLDFVNLDDDEKKNIWLHIWCKSILRNTWTDIDKDNPVDSVRDTVFFRLVEFAFMQGADISTYLPNPDRILECEELGQLRTDQNFQYLLQTGSVAIIIHLHMEIMRFVSAMNNFRESAHIRKRSSKKVIKVTSTSISTF